MTISPFFFALICLAGGLGSVLRAALTARLSRKMQASVAILIINATGSFLIGAAFGRLPDAGTVALPVGFSLLAIGLLGGFTTVSTFALQVLDIWQAGRRGFALQVALGSALLCPALAVLGVAVARMV
ncbi:MAG: CrcB family protein [Natronohydrobacter sp.]|nr:CrcB family protein [Natronohydrobacter sp.]